MLHDPGRHQMAQASQCYAETHRNKDAMLALLGASYGGATAKAQIAMANKPADYGVISLLKKFWARPWYERWSHVWYVVRGLLRFCQIDSPYLVLMGRGVVINKHTGRFTTGGVCVLRPACRIAVVGKGDSPAHLHIGEGTEIGDRTIINVSQRVEIGARCSISWDCEISDTDFHQVILIDGQRPPVTKPVIIEDDVWVGSHCLILKGVTIGHHSVIAAGSVVHHDVPPYSLVVGNPARRVSQIAGWQR
jgi:acetyltransferase-like isoleucine patch superfamily enzyme